MSFEKIIAQICWSPLLSVPGPTAGSPPVPNAAQSYGSSESREKEQSWAGPRACWGHCLLLPTAAHPSPAGLSVPIVVPMWQMIPHWGCVPVPTAQSCGHCGSDNDKPSQIPFAQLFASFPQRAAHPQVSTTFLRLLKGLPGLKKGHMQQRKIMKME